MKPVRKATAAKAGRDLAHLVPAAALIPLPPEPESALAPAGFTCGLLNTGHLHITVEGQGELKLKREYARALVGYLEMIATAIKE